MIEVTELMKVDTNEPSDPQIENSPTLTSAVHAPIPCASKAPSNAPTDKLDDILTMMHKGFENMGNIVDSKLEKALALINSRLRQLEGAPCQPDDYYPNWGQGNVDIDLGAVNYATPEQLELLQIQQESKEYETQYTEYEEEEERCIQEDKRHAEKWRTATDAKKREMIAAEGGDPDIVMRNDGDRAKPIYVPDSQESTFLPRLAPQLAGRQPILGLEWKTVGKKQVNALPTIGGSYASRAGKVATTQPSPPAKATPTAQTPPAFTSERLHARSTTKAAIVQNARDALNTCLSITKPKAELIRAYENILASRPAAQGTPTNWMPTPVLSPSALANGAPRRLTRKPTSNWIIRRLPGTETIDYHKPFNGNAYTMIKAIEACL
jgi:hypothetical protein